jgi:hypothetical protein
MNFKKTMLTAVRLTFSAMIIFTLLQGCKKDSGGDTNSSGYYLTANVNGTAWSANVNSTLNNAPAVAAATSSNGISVILVLGVKAVNTDSSAIVVIFPQNITVNQQYSFDDSKFSEAAYITSASPGSTTYYGYNTTAATGGSGTITVTAFDQTAKIVEGNFSGTFGSQTGRAPVQVTNGKFRCPYTTDVNQLPKSGGIKI